MQKEEHRFHGAEYVPEHNQESINNSLPIDPLNIYNSLEEILDELNTMYGYEDRMEIIEKLKDTIKVGKYIQDGTK